MYQAHQGATSLRAFFEAEEIGFQGGDQQQRVFGLDGSASVQGDALTISVVNPHVEGPVEATIELRGGRAQGAWATVLSARDIHAHNAFDTPDALKPETRRLDVSGSQWRYTFAPASATVLRVLLG
jgi:alpha-N-arabinofuranosidase